MLPSKVKRVLGAAAAIAMLAVASTVLAVPAGAGNGKNQKFCQTLSSGDGAAGINFDGLGPAEAKYAAKLTRKLANTGVPGALETDLKKLAKIYDRIAKGASAGKVIRQEEKFITTALTRFSKYTVANCTPAVPST